MSMRDAQAVLTYCIDHPKAVELVLLLARQNYDDAALQQLINMVTPREPHRPILTSTPEDIAAQAWGSRNSAAPKKP